MRGEGRAFHLMAVHRAGCCGEGAWPALQSHESSTERGVFSQHLPAHLAPQRAARHLCRTCWTKLWGTGTVHCLSISTRAHLTQARARAWQYLDGRHVRKMTFPVQIRHKSTFTQSITPRLMKLTFERESHAGKASSPLPWVGKASCNLCSWAQQMLDSDSTC